MLVDVVNESGTCILWAWLVLLFHKTALNATSRPINMKLVHKIVPPLCSPIGTDFECLLCLSEIVLLSLVFAQKVLQTFTQKILFNHFLFDLN